MNVRHYAHTFKKQRVTNMNNSLLTFATKRANSMMEKDGSVNYQGLKLLVGMYADSPAELNEVMFEIGSTYNCTVAELA